MTTSGDLFISDRAATQAEVERAESMLKRDGLIPVEDRSGHRVALELWRRNCQRAEPSPQSMLTAVRNLLEQPRVSFEHVLQGSARTPRLAWVRPDDILITDHPDFPYHLTVEELAQLASNLIAEQGDPEMMAEILGEDYGLSTVTAPHGLLHMVHHNGNHRTAAIRAAGFPVALVETERYESPWMLPMHLRTHAYMRLLFRAGLLSNPHERMASSTPKETAGSFCCYLPPARRRP